MVYLNLNFFEIIIILLFTMTIQNKLLNIK